MAINTNTVTLTGNLTREPELRFTPSGQATASFGIAVNRRWQNRQSHEWEEATDFFDVVAWGELAEHLAQSLEKGSRAVIVGRLSQRSWETSEGDKRYKIEVVAEDVAASFKYATAQITRIQRQQAGQGPAQGQQSPAYSGAASGSSYDYEEEPF